MPVFQGSEESARPAPCVKTESPRSGWASRAEGHRRDAMPRPRSRSRRTRWFSGPVASLFCGCDRERSSPSPRDAELVEIGTEIQLVADDLALERITALRRRLNPLTSTPANPILRAEKAWEGQSTMPLAVL